jgi:hypothetical protein
MDSASRQQQVTMIDLANGAQVTGDPIQAEACNHVSGKLWRYDPARRADFRRARPR